MDSVSGGLLAQLNVYANVVVVAGYLLVPFTVLRYLPLTKPVLASGLLFFLTCAITHLSMALGVEHHRLMVANHCLQAVSVVWFVLGFARLLKRARHAQQVRDAPPEATS